MKIDFATSINLADLVEISINQVFVKQPKQSLSVLVGSAQFILISEVEQEP